MIKEAENFEENKASTPLDSKDVEENLNYLNRLLVRELKNIKLIKHTGAKNDASGLSVEMIK